jgi:hypothetical protein
MPDEAVTMIMEAQPYQRKDSGRETLSLISRLENADKHRQLLVLGHGGMNARSVVTAGGEAIKQETAGFRENGAEIAKFGFSGQVPPESAVTVEVRGMATIAIQVAGADGYFGMPESLEALIGWMRDSVIPDFTPFVRPD